MNQDHPADNLLLATAFGYPEATASTMVDVDASAGTWQVIDPAGEHQLRLEWPAGAARERVDIRRGVVDLYTAACARLGVPARNSESTKATADTAPAPFSKVLRESSWSDHADSESAEFMDAIMRGTGTLADYTELVAQHYFMYEALEAAAQQLSTNTQYSSFHPPALHRLDAIAADLHELLGPQWRSRITALPATAAYAARITTVSDRAWLPGIIAHHYTRYLGDLSGGQMIARQMVKQHGAEKASVKFYNFAELGKINEFKTEYRAALDRLGAQLSASERQAMIDEVITAYHFNTRVFVELAAEKRARG